MSVDWTTVDLAIRTWLAAGTGVALDHVLPMPLGGHRPSSPYLGYSYSVALSGRDWIRVEDKTTPIPGAEISVIQEGVRRLTTSVQLWATPIDGSDSAHSRLVSLTGKSQLPSRQILRDADVSLIMFGSVGALSSVINQTKQDPRATLTITFDIPSSAVEDATYIERANVERITTP